MKDILLVEDNRHILDGNRYFLEKAGYTCAAAETIAGAKEIIGEETPRLMILDLMLPDGNGLDLLSELRASSDPALSGMPVLILTARDAEADKVIGLGAGADDYMTKPFSMRELIARCKALLRRVERAKVIAKNSENEKLLDFGSMVIDPAQRIVTVNGEQVHLTPTEFDLLATLARRPKSVLTREKLLEEVWDWVDASGTRTVDSHVKALRHKLGSETIRTVHGVGYAFEPPEQ